jgi:dienelactone hydrolase
VALVAAVVAALFLRIEAGGARGQQDEPIRPGAIVPNIAVRAEPAQSYALYLPATYDPARKWPALYAFDPAARGLRPVQCFREAAEKHGYVLVGSNVSRNGPMGPSLQAGLAMIRDTLERFAIDERRLFVTGFSGGARVASAMAIMQKGRIAGVIGCGGGFPVGEQPGAGTEFAFCGAIGEEDFNWLEMNRLDRALASLGKPHRLLRFPGGHAWPPADAAMAALEWLELEAMRAGTRAKDTGLVETWLQRDLQRSRDAETRGAPYEVWLGYSGLVTTYRGLADVQPLEARAAELQRQEAVKREIKSERDGEQRELRQQAEISRYIGQLSDIEQQLDATRNLHGLIDVLSRGERGARTRSERLLARRLLEFTSITAYYAGEPLLESGDHRSALACFELQAAIHPESADVHYRIALTHGRAGNRNKALESLKNAADRGFSDAQRIEREAAFEPLRNDPRYVRVLEVIRANGKPR